MYAVAYVIHPQNLPGDRTACFEKISIVKVKFNFLQANSNILAQTIFDIFLKLEER